MSLYAQLYGPSTREREWKRDKREYRFGKLYGRVKLQFLTTNSRSIIHSINFNDFILFIYMYVRVYTKTLFGKKVYTIIIYCLSFDRQFFSRKLIFKDKWNKIKHGAKIVLQIILIITTEKRLNTYRCNGYTYALGQKWFFMF